MGISVGVASPGTISSVGVNNGGSQGGYNPQGSNYSPQKSVSPISTYNPQNVATFNQQVPTTLTGLYSANNSMQNYLNNASAQDRAMQAQTQSLLQQVLAADRAAATPAPVLNYSQIMANAQAQASGANSAVNQLYNQQLNQYLQNEAAQKALAQQQNQLSVQSAQQSLANTQAQLGQQQQFTGQQTAMNLGNIANQQNYYQQNQGQQGEANMNALRQQLGQGNLGASGLGQQQEFQQNLTRQIQEGQQENQFEYQRNAQLLNESNTFANIAQSGKYAQQQEGTAESQANLSLNKFLQAAAYNQSQAEAYAKSWQQEAQITAAQNIASKQVAQFIDSYKNNPLLYSKAMSAYGNLLSGGGATSPLDLSRFAVNA